MNHRRPNPDELTPDDLFRPAGGPPAGYGAPLPEPEAQGASTQYLPPMPAAPEQQGYPQQGYQQQGGYPPAQPAQQPYQPFPQQQTQPYGQPQGGYDQGGYDQGGYDDYGYDEDPHRNRPSMKTLTIAVVAGCAVLGIGLGALLHGGGAAANTTAKGGAKHTGAANHTADKAAEAQQAQALSALLDTASANRLAVVGAVVNITQCKALPQDQQTLTQAAQDRANLVTQLGQLQVDALPSGQDLVAKLTAGWNASQQADTHYAAWAAASMDSCGKKHKPQAGGEHAAGDSASYTATTAKREAAALWNRIANANGLPTRSYSNL